MQMGLSSALVSLFLSWVFFASVTHQLKNYETQVLLQLRKHLEYPAFLSVWENFTANFCLLNSLPNLSIKCENESVIELRIVGDKPSMIPEFVGYAVPNQTLSPGFSIDSFITTLARLSSLKVITLVSLGIWGPLSAKIHRLHSLEALDMSSNFLFGSIPPEISRMVELGSLIVDGNFFNDTIPDWLPSLRNLTILNLKNNRFKGQVPDSVSDITALNELVLSHNLLSGKLPDLRKLSGLQLIDLRDNKLHSKLPPLPKGLSNLFLSNNSFSGSIPQQFGELKKLQHLDLSVNNLSGTLPSVLFSLPNLSYLNLSSNSLTGSLPEHLHCGGALSLVDISNNRLQGQLPKCLDTDAENRLVTIGGNCFSVIARDQLLEAYCKENVDQKGNRMRKIAMLVSVILGVVLIVFIIFVVALLFFRRYCGRETVIQQVTSKNHQDDPPSAISSDLLASARFISEVAKVGGNQGAPSYNVFSIEQLEEATKNFDESNFLGAGSLGKVYKGKLDTNTIIVVREVALYKKYSIRNLKLRLNLFSKLRHPLLVGLLGFCIEERKQDEPISRLLLVQEFVPNGNYRSRLTETSPEKLLKWSDRLAILIGIAKAVLFLHTRAIPPSVDNRLKTNNILIDEHGIAKLGDYGMSILAEEIEKPQVKSDAGKFGYVADRDDVYDFGFILLESIVGAGKGQVLLPNETVVYALASMSSQDWWQKIVDPCVVASSCEESINIVVSITKRCISPEAIDRPSLEDVLWNLQYAAQVQTTAESERAEIK